MTSPRERHARSVCGENPSQRTCHSRRAIARLVTTSYRGCRASDTGCSRPFGARDVIWAASPRVGSGCDFRSLATGRDPWHETCHGVRTGVRRCRNPYPLARNTAEPPEQVASRRLVVLFGARWCQSSRAGSDPRGPAVARSTPSRAGPSMPARLRGAKSPWASVSLCCQRLWLYDTGHARTRQISAA